MYSLYDLFQDINNGRRSDFVYKEEKFLAHKKGINKWIITHVASGFIATCPYYIGNATELQGVAACLLEEKRNLEFTTIGGLIPTNKLSYIIDLDERGLFSAHVENSNGIIIYNIGEDTTLFEDGYMNHKHDTAGLEGYLKGMAVISYGTSIIS